MNLSTISRLPAEPAPILGKSLRQQREEREAAERAAKPSGPPPMTSAPAGYELTAQGGYRRVGQPAVIPEVKGRALKADDSEQVAFECWLQRECPSGDGEDVQRQWEASSDYDEWRAQRDDGPCGVVPSFKDVILAAKHADNRMGCSSFADHVIRRFSGNQSAFCITVPADRRADVIRELNKLGS